MVDTNFQINDNSEAKPKSTTLYNSKINAIYSKLFHDPEHKCIFHRKERKEKKRKEKIFWMVFIRRSILNAQHTVNKFTSFLANSID